MASLTEKLQQLASALKIRSRRRRVRAPQGTATGTVAGASAVIGARHRGWIRYSLLVLGLLLAVAWFSPAIVANTGLLHVILARAIPAEQGRLTAGSASLGWFSPVEIYELHLQDAEGDTLATVEKIACRHTLYALLRAPSQIGTVTLTRPEITDKLRGEGSAWQDFLGPYLQEPLDPAEALISAEIEIQGGKATLADTAGGQSWTIGQVQGKCSLPERLPAPLLVSLAGNFEHGDHLAPVELKMEMPLAGEEGTAATARLATRAMPLAPLNPLLQRYAGDITVEGQLGTALTARWGGRQGGTVAVEGTTTVARLRMTAPQLGSNTLRLERAHLPLSVQIDGTRLQVAQAELDCDVGQVTAAGVIDLAQTDLSTLLTVLLEEGASARGRVDVAKLAPLAPELLKLRADTRLTAGVVSFDLKATPWEDGQRVHGKLETTPLTAVSRESEIRWESPIQAAFDVRRNSRGWHVEQADCEADFVQVAISGTPAKLQGTATVDLDRLTGQLGQFFDLSNLQLAGRGKLEFDYQQPAPDRFASQATLTAADFVLAYSGVPPWQEPALDVQAAASGTRNADGAMRIDAASLALSAGTDRLTATLAEPVPVADGLLELSGRLHVTGDSESWLARLRRLEIAPAFAMTGAVDARLAATWQDDLLQVSDLQGTVRPCTFTGYGVAVDADHAQLKTAGSLSLAQRHIRFKDTDLQLGTFAASTDDLQIALAEPAAFRARGQVALSGEISDVLRWLKPTLSGTTGGPAPSWNSTGKFSGQAAFQHEANVTEGTIQFSGSDLTLLTLGRDAQGNARWQPAWNEPKPTLTAKLKYRAQDDRLELSQLDAAAHYFKLSASGTLSSLMTTATADFQAVASYDWKTLRPLLQPYLGEDVVIEGTDTAQIAIRGPLLTTADGPHWSMRLQGTAQFGWQRAELYGMEVGSARTTVRLRQGWLQSDPLDIPVSDGKLASRPAVQLNQPPLQLYLPKGPLLSKVKLTKRFCNQPVKYIAPLVAQATETEGSISLDLDGARIPLADPAQTDLGGRVTIHKADVLAGPLAQDLILITRQIEAILKRQNPPLELDDADKPLLSISDQTVPVRVVGQRVYHQSLAMKLDTVQVYSSGSVGLDQSLAIAVDVPIQDDWLAQDRLLAAFKGQMVRVYIGGTLARPSIDRRSIEQLAGQMVRTATRGVLQNELEKQFNKLFGPR